MKNIFCLFRGKGFKETMNIKVENSIPNIKVSVNQNADGSFSIALSEVGSVSKKLLRDIPCGGTFRIGDHEFVVLEQSDDTTAVITKDSVKKMAFGKDGNYVNSDIRKYCNGEFFDKIACEIGAVNIVEHTVDLMADDGTGKNISCKDKVSILTTDLYRRYREFLPACGYSWWLATRVSASIKDWARCVCCVCSDGTLNWSDCGYSLVVRPFLILKSSISVS